jgi:hypothetical protein
MSENISNMDTIFFSGLLAIIVLLLLSCICKRYCSDDYVVLKYDEEAPPPYDP